MTATAGASFAVLRSEYFENASGGTALDHHIVVECCEMRYQGTVFVDRAVLPLPAGAHPPLPGFNAADAYTTINQPNAVIQSVENAKTAIWGHEYVHDTSNRPRQTPSGTVHWMQYDLEYATGSAAATVVTGD